MLPSAPGHGSRAVGIAQGRGSQHSVRPEQPTGITTQPDRAFGGLRGPCAKQTSYFRRGDTPSGGALVGFRNRAIFEVGPTSSPRFGAARQTGIALSADAVRASPEQNLASPPATTPLPQNYFSMNRHLPMQADLDNGDSSYQGGTRLVGDLLLKIAVLEPRRSNRRMIATSARIMGLAPSTTGKGIENYVF